MTLEKYPYTSKIICANCGKHFQRKHNNAGTKYEKVVWVCSTYNRLGKDKCSSKQIPEGILDSITTAFNKEIQKIIAYPNNKLKFIFSDDSDIVKEWSY